MCWFNLFGGIFDFDGDGKIDENDALLGSLFSEKDEDDLYDPEDHDENEEYDDPFDAQDYSNAEEFYEDHSGDFSDFEDAEDYFDDWN